MPVMRRFKLQCTLLFHITFIYHISHIIVFLNIFNITSVTAYNYY